MTRIDFYFNVVDKQQAIFDLVQSALSKRRQVVVFVADEKMASDVSVRLWQNKAESFLPNVRTHSLHSPVTPVVIALQDHNAIISSTQDDMLINLTKNEPIFFSRFTQLIELVSDDEQDKMAARARFKFYRDRGYEIKCTNYAQI